MNKMNTTDYDAFYALLGHQQTGGLTACVALIPASDAYEDYITKKVYVKSGKEIKDFANKYNGHAQCYVSNNPVRLDISPGDDHKDEDITHVCNIIIDVDPEKHDLEISDKEVKRYAATDVEKEKAVKNADIVEGYLKSDGYTFYRDDSGNGSRFVIALEPIPLTKDNRKHIKAHLKATQHAIRDKTGVKIDTSVYDLRRLTGIPGTLNLKKETDTRKNRMRIPSLPIPERKECSKVREFIFSQKTTYSKEDDKSTKPCEEVNTEDGFGYAGSSRKIENILLDWIEYDNLRHNGKLGRLLKGDISEYCNDRSDAEMALYTILRRYRFSIDEIEYILSSGVMGKWGSSDGGESYQNATREKALSHTSFVALETYNDIKNRKDETLPLSDILAKGTLVNGARLTINLPENHFILKYVQWMGGLTDAYPDYSIMCAFWLLSAACQGNVYLDLKQGPIYTNLYILLFGLSTVSRKTTVIKKTKIVFESCTQERLYNDDYSLEGYLELLEECPVSNMVRDEVVGLFQKYEKKYNDGIHEAECAIYDGEPYRKTLSSGRQGKKREVVVDDPYVTHLYATTPDNFSHCLSLENFYSGFGFRFLYCHPMYNRERMPLVPATAKDREAFAEIVTEYMHLYDMFQNVNEKIKFTVDSSAMDYLEHIRVKVEDLITEMNDNNMSSAWGRNCDHILKLAMLIEIGKEVPSFNISLETMQEACRITTEYFLPTCIETLNRLQEDVKNNKIEKVRGLLVRSNGTCDHGKLLRNSNMVSREFNEVILTMVESGEIEIAKEDSSKRTWYILKNDSTKDKLRSLSSYNSYDSYVSKEKTNDTNFTNSESEDKNICAGTYCLDSLYESTNDTNVTNVTNQLNCEDKKDDNSTPHIEECLDQWEKFGGTIFSGNSHKAKLDIVKFNKMRGVDPQLIFKVVDQRAKLRCVECGSSEIKGRSDNGEARCTMCYNKYANRPALVIPDEISLEPAGVTP